MRIGMEFRHRASYLWVLVHDGGDGTERIVLFFSVAAKGITWGRDYIGLEAGVLCVGAAMDHDTIKDTPMKADLPDFLWTARFMDRARLANIIQLG